MGGWTITYFEKLPHWKHSVFRQCDDEMKTFCFFLGQDDEIKTFCFLWVCLKKEEAKKDFRFFWILSFTFQIRNSFFSLKLSTKFFFVNFWCDISFLRIDVFGGKHGLRLFNLPSDGLQISSWGNNLTKLRIEVYSKKTPPQFSF